VPRTTPPARLSRADLSLHLAGEPAGARRTVLALRRAVLHAAPKAAEALKFHVLCYSHADAYFGAIGGNICMIEVKKGRVLLSFIHGSLLEDPGSRLGGTGLTGKGKFKRFIRVDTPGDAQDPAIRALVKRAAALRPWD